MSKNAMISSDRLGVMGILRESLKIFPKNWKVMAYITLLTLLPYSLIFLANYFSVNTIISNLTTDLFLLASKEPGSPEYLNLLTKIKEDAGVLICVELVFMVVYWVASVFFMVATIYTSAMTYSGKDLTLKELFSRIGSTWRGPLITSFFIALLRIGYNLLVVPLVVFVMLVAQTSMALASLGVLVLLLVLCIYPYLFVVWMVSLVVSVVEDGCYGMKALGKAVFLIKGRRLQGCVLMLLQTVVLIPIFWYFGTKMGDINSSQTIRLAWSFVMINSSCLVGEFTSMVYTVFYYQCKKTHGEEVELQGVKGYTLVPNIPHVSAALP